MRYGKWCVGVPGELFYFFFKNPIKLPCFVFFGFFAAGFLLPKSSFFFVAGAGVVARPVYVRARYDVLHGARDTHAQHPVRDCWMLRGLFVIHGMYDCRCACRRVFVCAVVRDRLLFIVCASAGGRMAVHVCMVAQLCACAVGGWCVVV